MSDFLQEFKRATKEQTKEEVYLTQCPFCSMQCTKIIHEEKLILRSRITVAPNKLDPVSEGKLCIKGMNAHGHSFHEQRLRTPMLKKNGIFESVTWEEAMEWFTSQVRDLQSKRGKDAIAVYGGGSLTNEESYLLGKFARVALQTPYIDYNGRFCMSSAASAANQTFGIDRGLTNPLSDIELAKCIIIAGANIADCQPTMMPYLRKAKAKGCNIIVVDPRETGTTKIADIHLKIKPGMDAVLVNGMLKVLLDEGYVDYSFIQEATKGFPELASHTRKVNLVEVARLTGVTKEQIKETAHLYGSAATSMVFTARGVEQHSTGVKNVQNYINLALVTGKIGKPGCGYGAITGQANGQGGREHGQKADQLPGYRSIEEPQHRAHVAGVWGISEADLPRKGVSAYELFQAADTGTIRGMIVMGSNPVVSNPNAHFVETVIINLDMLVVIDMFLSETAQYADLVLPCASYLEDQGTFTNLEGRVILREAVKTSPTGVRTDWEILCTMAQHLGKGHLFTYESSKEIFEELRKASQGGVADYYGITYERIKSEKGVFWPCPDEIHPGTTRMFEDRRFYHEDGKARFAVVAHQYPTEQENSGYPLVLTTGRVMHHYLSGVQTRHTLELNQKYPEPLLEIHPDTAENYKLTAGGLAKLISRRGEISLKVKYSPGIRKDTVFVPFHWGGEQSINRLTNPSLDPQCRMPEFKACAVRVEPVNEIQRQKDNMESEKSVVLI